MSDSGSIDPTNLTKMAYKKMISAIAKPIKKIINNSFQSGVVPKCLKVVMIELLKKARKTQKLQKTLGE